MESDNRILSDQLTLANRPAKHNAFSKLHKASCDCTIFHLALIHRQSHEHISKRYIFKKKAKTHQKVKTPELTKTQQKSEKTRISKNSAKK